MAKTVQGELFPNPPPKCLMEAIIRRLPRQDLLTVTDVADSVNVSVNTIYTWIESGSVEAINISVSNRPCWKLYRASVLKHLEQRLAGNS